MCTGCGPSTGPTARGTSPGPSPSPSRRAFLLGAAALPLAALLPVRTAGAREPLQVQPRAAWAQGLEPTGPLQPEPDVRFLLVHHSATTNAYTDAAAELREFYRLHTGPERGWADIAYNFLVDHDGTVWEGRAGSLQGAVQPSATGGSQGFAQLACFIGDHGSTPPTAAARTSMLRLLAALADRHGLDTRPGATATFVSRGSNRWPRGQTVTARTLSGHRDMSDTSCPGETVYAQLREAFPREVSALRAGGGAPAARAATPGPRPTPSPTAAPPTAPTGPGTAGSPTAGSPTAGPTAPDPTAPGPTPGSTGRTASAGATLRGTPTPPTTSSPTSRPVSLSGPGASDDVPLVVVAAAGGALLAAAGAGVAASRRRPADATDQRTGPTG